MPIWKSLPANISSTDAPADYTFIRTYHQETTQIAKTCLDIAIRAIVSNPELGEEKIGDLAGTRIYKFNLCNQLCLIAYRVLDQETLKLLTFGPHENFYRNLKRLKL